MKLNELTIILPFKDGTHPIAQNCVNHTLKSVKRIPILIVDENGRDDHYVSDKRLSFLHCTDGKKSLTKIWNTCIKECKTEYFVLVMWRSRIETSHIKKIQQYLSSGFGMVALGEMHVFAFSKHLTTQIGFFDEGFPAGQYEDTDWVNRLAMNDVAMYFSNEVPEEYHPSTWSSEGAINLKYYKSKWIEAQPKLIQLKEEANIEDRQLYQGVFKERQYLPFSESILRTQSVKNYFYNIFTEKEKRFL